MYKDVNTVKLGGESTRSEKKRQGQKNSTQIES